MSTHAAAPGSESLPTDPSVRATIRKASDYWWAFLVAGIAWSAISLVILQFNSASITTVGILVGLLFTLATVQNVAIASAPDTAFGSVPTGARVVSGLFAVLFAVSAVICFVEPADTFAGLADVLGFLFLLVGIWWMVRAFWERAINSAWWLTLISGILMTIMAFWTSGQLFITKVYVLLVFAGVWALMEGITNIIRAFEIRDLRDEV
jgi:uncharacterized membrane protein HdeD (DUF308 family)